MKIKNEKIELSVKVVIGCTKPESFSSQEEFQTEDGAAMKEYIAEKIKDALTGAWQYAARVESFSVTKPKVLHADKLADENKRLKKELRETKALLVSVSSELRAEDRSEI